MSYLPLNWTYHSATHDGKRVRVIFNYKGARIGCDYFSSTYKYVIPEYLRQATLLWSGTDYRNSMTLQEFLDSTVWSKE